MLGADKNRRLWCVNVASFLALSLLAVTGLVNWLLPRGGGPNALRHALVAVHRWAAVAFLVLVVLHVILHWGYVKANLRRGGWLK
jgi:hypothetical protein